MQQQRRYNVRAMLMQRVARKVISHPSNPITYVWKLPYLCPRLYMGTCAERKLADVRLARLVLRVPITAALLPELRNILLHGCRLRFGYLHLFLLSRNCCTLCPQLYLQNLDMPHQPLRLITQP